MFMSESQRVIIELFSFGKKHFEVALVEVGVFLHENDKDSPAS